MPVQQCWQQLHSAIWNPWFHLKFVAERLQLCFWTSSPLYKLFAYSFWLTVLGLVTYTHSWSTFIIVWLIPATVLFQVATCLRLCAEHTLPDLNVMRHRDKIFTCDATPAVFIGEATPDSDLTGWANLKAWSQWYFRMLLIHAPSRFLVINGDSVVHDLHHRHPGTDEWVNGIWERQEEQDNGCPKFPKPYTEIWGLTNAINATFESLSKLPPDFTQ